MIGSYTVEGSLYLNCMSLINEVFPGAQKMANRGDKYGACWSKVSTPFYITENNQIIGHIGIIPFTLHLLNNSYNVAAIHAVCIKESFRGTGYFQPLMEETLGYVNEHYDFSMLFTDQPFLYQKFGFRAVYPWYQWKYKTVPTLQKKQAPSRQLNLDNESDLLLFKKIVETKILLSDNFNIAGKETEAILLLNAMDCVLEYFDELDTIIVYKTDDKKLIVKDIICNQLIDLETILSSVSDDFESIVFGFDPSKFIDSKKMTPVLSTDHGCMMVNANIQFPKIFVYPELYYC